jgi:hypothetical protein
MIVNNYDRFKGINSYEKRVKELWSDFMQLRDTVEEVLDDDIGWFIDGLEDLYVDLLDVAIEKDEKESSDERLQELSADSKYHMMIGD